MEKQYGRFEGMEPKSIKQIYLDEIEMVKNNRYMNASEKEIKVKELKFQLEQKLYKHG